MKDFTNEETERMLCEMINEGRLNAAKEIREIKSSKPSDDPIVEILVSKIRQRSMDGIKEYGTTLERTDLSPLDWLNEAQTEAIDFTLYLERIKRDYEIFKSIIRTTPNDQELGRKIRKIYG